MMQVKSQSVRNAAYSTCSPLVCIDAVQTLIQTICLNPIIKPRVSDINVVLTYIYYIIEI